MKRLDDLKDFKTTLSKIEFFLNGTESIEIIDPNQKLADFGCSVDRAIEWVENEIVGEEIKATVGK